MVDSGSVSLHEIAGKWRPGWWGGAALNKGQRRGGADPAMPSVPHSGREVASSQRRRSLGGKKNGVAGAIFNVAGVMFKAEKEKKKKQKNLAPADDRVSRPNAPEINRASFIMR